MLSYKWCAVPKCSNTSLKTPEKFFICAPKNEEMRRKWLQLARRNYDIKPSSVFYFCEDHFNLKQDMANYYQYKLGLSKRIRMVDKVLPSKFSCQPDYNNVTFDASSCGSALVKRRKFELIHESENTLQQPTIIEPCVIDNIPIEVPSKGSHIEEIASTVLCQENIIIKTEFVPIENEEHPLWDSEHLENTPINIKIENEFDEQFEITENFPYELPVMNIVMLTNKNL